MNNHSVPPPGPRTALLPSLRTEGPIPDSSWACGRRCAPRPRSQAAARVLLSPLSRPSPGPSCSIRLTDALGFANGRDVRVPSEPLGGAWGTLGGGLRGGGSQHGPHGAVEGRTVSRTLAWAGWGPHEVKPNGLVDLYNKSLAL